MVLEVTGNAWEIARILEPHVGEVLVVHPGDTGIRQARAKTDRLVSPGGDSSVRVARSRAREAAVSDERAGAGHSLGQSMREFKEAISARTPQG